MVNDRTTFDSNQTFFADTKSIRKHSPLFIFIFIFILIFFAFLAFLVSSFVILFIFICILLLSVYPLLLKLWDRLYKVKDLANQCFYARTPDGWDLAIHLHSPEATPIDKYPVILCHGLAVNKYSVDLDASHSMAYFLKQQGYTVFAVNLRGVGGSYHISGQKNVDFSFDDIVEHDVPTIIEKVCEVTDQDRVIWIGHSMGAMIAQAFMGRQLPGCQNIACFVNLAGPGRVDHVSQKTWRIFSRYPWISRFIDLRFIARILAPLFARDYTQHIEKLFYNKSNLRSSTIRHFMSNALESVTPGLSGQLSWWVQQGKETTIDGRFDYRQGLKNITIPALIMAGAGDRIVIPEAVHFVWENIQSQEKKFVLLSKENGFPMDYCHASIVVGERVRQDVFPIVLNWLEKYSQNNRHS